MANRPASAISAYRAIRFNLLSHLPTHNPTKGFPLLSLSPLQPHTPYDIKLPTAALNFRPLSS